jgi:hypothetical protein
MPAKSARSDRDTAQADLGKAITSGLSLVDTEGMTAHRIEATPGASAIPIRLAQRHNRFAAEDHETWAAACVQMADDLMTVGSIRPLVTREAPKGTELSAAQRQ